jgi:uncharacterized protein (TIGR04255 family)
MNSKGASFTPINQAHAIVEVVMFVQFEQEFDDSSIQKLLELAQDLKTELPQGKMVQRFEATATFELGKLQSQNMPTSIKTVGVDLQSTKNDDTIAWRLFTTNNTFSVHCLDYSTWIDVWNQAKQYLYKAFQKIGETNNKISIMGLKYIDRFLYEGHEEEYTASDLFNINTDLIFRYAFSSIPIWHNNVGWFENLEEIGACLNQLNISTVYENISGEQKHITIIDHNAVYREEVPKDFPLIVGNKDDINTSLHRTMNALHSMNKRVLTRLLTEQMARRINLNAGVA